MKKKPEVSTGHQDKEQSHGLQYHTYTHICLAMDMETDRRRTLWQYIVKKMGEKYNVMHVREPEI